MKSTGHISAIVLAAGKGTRIGQGLPKVLNQIAGKPMLYYTLKLLKPIGISDKYVVIGFKSDEVKASIGSNVNYVYQWQQQGTADAVKVALQVIPPGSTSILVLNGDDSAFYNPSTIRTLINEHKSKDTTLSIITLITNSPDQLGRVIRDNLGNVQRVVEEKEATQEEIKIKEVNIGCYLFDYQWLQANINIIKAKSNNEYYLTDLIEIAHSQKRSIGTISINEDQWVGVNTKEQLVNANKKMVKRLSIRKRHNLFIIDLDNTLINTDKIIKDTSEKIDNLCNSTINLSSKPINKSYSKKFWRIYEDIRQEKRYIDLPEICRKFTQIINEPQLEIALKQIFFTINFKEYISESTSYILEKLRLYGEVIILAEGDLVFQPIKINNSGLIKMVDDYYTFENFEDGIEQIESIYKDWNIFLIDDQAGNLIKSMKNNKSITPIWVKQGKYGKQNEDVYKERTANNLLETLSEIEKIVSK